MQSDDGCSLLGEELGCGGGVVHGDCAIIYSTSEVTCCGAEFGGWFVAIVLPFTALLLTGWLGARAGRIPRKLLGSASSPWSGTFVHIPGE